MIAFLHDPFQHPKRHSLIRGTRPLPLPVSHLALLPAIPQSPSLALWNAQAKVKGCQAEFPKLHSHPGDQSLYV